MEDKLELRMYGIVPYNISAIQQAIQFGHATVEYGQMVKREKTDVLYNDWADNWKTFIILNGGTSNHSQNRYHEGEFTGSMEGHLITLNEIGIPNATFYEPDLNDMLSAVVFIVDERVFNRKKYLDLGDWIWMNKSEYLTDRMITTQKIDKMYRNGYFQTDANKDEREIYEEWVNSIGGEKNVRLRDFLSGLKLA
jgi:hypothetical protein